MFPPIKHGDGSPGVTLGPGVPVDSSVDVVVEGSLVVVMADVEGVSSPVSVTSLVLVVVGDAVVMGGALVGEPESAVELVLSSHPAAHASTRGPQASWLSTHAQAKIAKAFLVIGLEHTRAQPRPQIEWADRGRHVAVGFRRDDRDQVFTVRVRVDEELIGTLLLRQRQCFIEAAG